MKKYKIEFVWFFQGDSFEECVSLPARSQHLAVEKVKSVWGDNVEVTYYELEI